MRTIRASEIGTYLYCQRAWWYQKRGEPSINQAELAGGSELHYRHGRAAFASGCLRSIAYGLLLLAVVLLTVYLTQQAL
jgi:hypothetical protein